MALTLEVRLRWFWECHRSKLMVAISLLTSRDQVAWEGQMYQLKISRMSSLYFVQIKNLLRMITYRILDI